MRKTAKRLASWERNPFLRWYVGKDLSQLSNEESDTIFLRWREGTRAERRQAWERISCSVIRLVVRMARPFLHANESFEDLLQEALYNGVHVAAMKFDPTNGARFSTYAIYWIFSALMRPMHEEGLLRLPANKKVLAIKMRQAIRAMCEIGVDQPTVYQIWSWVQKKSPSKKPVRLHAVGFLRAYLPDLDHRVRIEEEEISQEDAWYTEPPPLTALIALDEWRIRAELLERLMQYSYSCNQIDRMILAKNGIGRVEKSPDGGKGATLKEIGDEIGISRERVRQLETRLFRGCEIFTGISKEEMFRLEESVKELEELATCS